MASETPTEKTAAPEPMERSAGQAQEDEAVDKVRRGRPIDGSAEFDDVLREALGRLSAEGRLSSGHTVNFFGAVDVGGDMSVGRRAGRDAPDLITVEVGVELAHYVHPPGHDRAVEVFRRNRVVVLSGLEAVGKRMAAISIADSRGGSVCYLRLRRSLSEVSSVKLQAGTTYVVVDVPATLLTDLNDQWLRTTAAMLSEADAALVMTTSRSTPLRRAGLRSDCVIDGFGPPDVPALIRATAERTCPPEAKEVLGDLLELAEVAAVLTATTLPYAAAHVAASLVDVATGGQALDDALRLLSDATPRVSEWFTANPEPSDHAFAIAAAVLQGSSLALVADAALDLRSRISRRAAAPDLSFRKLLAPPSTWIEVVHGSQQSGFGAVPGELVRFADPGDAMVALRHAFDTYDRLRQPIAHWIRDLGGANQPVSVRARAAAAAGQMAVWDLPYCLQHIIGPWATDDTPEARRAAMLALSLCGNSADHSSQIWELLDHWCQMPDLGTVATAVGTLGGPLGNRSPAMARAAMACLRAVGERAEWSLVPDIAAAVLSIASGGQISTVLAGLLSWTNPKRAGSVQVTGLLAFLTVAIDCGESRPGQGWWPALLTTDRALRHSSVMLWARALDANSVRSWALEVFRTWVDLADLVPAARPVLAQVAADIADQNDRQDQRLSYWMHKWSTDPERPSAAAEEILSGIQEA
jgi:hypothetical protein